MSSSTAIITGAATGIGRAIAIALARQKFALTLTGRRVEPLDETASSCNETLVLPGDVSVPSHAQRLVDETVKRFGRIDAIVNNAGYCPVVPLEHMTDEQWRQIIDTNLSAAFYLCRAALPIFRRQKHGVVVNISSESSRDPFGGLGAYGAAKAGLNLLSLALSREAADIPVRVHTIAPAAVETEMFRRIVTPQQYPPDKTLDPADVADLVVQCIAGSLRHTTGEVIYVHKQPR